jgi:uncharacterized protein with von Willebrand factor type A (vWA) domain
VIDATGSAVAFARTLRAAGVPVTTDRVQRLVEALAALDPTRADDVYWAGRVTLCGGPDDLRRYDLAFWAFFSGESPHRKLRPANTPQTTMAPLGIRAPLTDPGEPEDDEEVPGVKASASPIEILRARDIAQLGRTDRDLLARLLNAFALAGEQRRTRRYRPAHRGPIDRARTVRDLLDAGGEPGRLRRRRHRRKPRRVVLLVDISGSMSPYADALLRFAHVASHRSGIRTEVFTIGTRLTRVTREMAHRDPDTALAAVFGAIPDWSGGTRLGELLKRFLDQWGQRGMARGAVVVILSDGWERGDATLLGEQMTRLARLAHRVVWANPRKGHEGYAPLAAGMAAALPHIDDFVEGHSLGALEQLAHVVAGHR